MSQLKQHVVQYSSAYHKATTVRVKTIALQLIKLKINDDEHEPSLRVRDSEVL